MFLNQMEILSNEELWEILQQYAYESTYFGAAAVIVGFIFGGIIINVLFLLVKWIVCKIFKFIKYIIVLIKQKNKQGGD